MIACTSAHDPEPMPATIPVWVFGNISEPTRSDITTKPSAIKVDQKNSATTTGQEVARVMNAVGSERIVSSAKILTGRWSVAANRSATQPQKKYPISQPSIGIQRILP